MNCLLWPFVRALCVELDDLALNWSVNNWMKVYCSDLFNFILTILWFYYDLYCPLMVAVLCFLLAIDVALSALPYVTLWAWPYWKILDVLWLFVYLESVNHDFIYLHVSYIVIYVFYTYLALSDHVRLWHFIMCILLR